MELSSIQEKEVDQICQRSPIVPVIIALLLCGPYQLSKAVQKLSIVKMEERIYTYITLLLTVKLTTSLVDPLLVPGMGGIRSLKWKTVQVLKLVQRICTLKWYNITTPSEHISTGELCFYPERPILIITSYPNSSQPESSQALFASFNCMLQCDHAI